METNAPVPHRKFTSNRSATINIEIDGNVYVLKNPTVAEIRNVRAEQRKENADEIEVSIKWLATLGLPEDVTDALPPKCLEDILDFILGETKKK